MAVTDQLQRAKVFEQITEANLSCCVCIFCTQCTKFRDAAGQWILKNDELTLLYFLLILMGLSLYQNINSSEKIVTVVTLATDVIEVLQFY